jgi:tetratricopeptide (TPR) repeat protein
MKAYYETKKYSQAVIYAEKVMSTQDTDQAAKDDSQIIIARSAFKTGDNDKAKKTYAKLTGAKGELGAEVLYYKAYFENKSAKYEVSNSTIQVLARDYAGYKYFGAKGLLVMADNFDKLDDAFQATYVLETVLSNFEDYPDVVEAATVQLKNLKASAALKKEGVSQTSATEVLESDEE